MRTCYDENKKMFTSKQQQHQHPFYAILFVRVSKWMENNSNSRFTVHASSFYFFFLYPAAKHCCFFVLFTFFVFFCSCYLFAFLPMSTLYNALKHFISKLIRGFFLFAVRFSQYSRYFSSSRHKNRFFWLLCNER